MIKIVPKCPHLPNFAPNASLKALIMHSLTFTGAQLRRSVAPFVRATPATFAPHCRPSAPQVQCNAGFGASSAGGKAPKAEKKKSRLTRNLDIDTSNSVVSDWIEMPDVDAVQSFVSKPIKPIILATGKAIMLYKVENTIYCTDANSTAYQYPLADANILGLKTGPAVEVNLDGTTYDLASGKVLSWCPKNTAVRSVLGALKDRSDPIDLQVYPVKVEGKKVFVKLAK